MRAKDKLQQYVVNIPLYIAQVYYNKDNGALATITANVPLTAQHRMEREYHILLVAPMAQPNVILVYELDKAYELCYDYLTRGRMG